MGWLLFVVFVVFLAAFAVPVILKKRREKRRTDAALLAKVINDRSLTELRDREQMDADAEEEERVRKAAEILELPAPVAKVLIRRVKKIKKKKRGRK